MTNDIMLKLIIGIFTVTFSTLLGYFFGAMKRFREEKQKTYSNILPIVIKMAYDPKSSNIDEFNTALVELWLYSSKKVATKMDDAISILHHPEKGDVTKAFQLVIAKMRSDIQIFPWQYIRSKNVKHFFSSITNK